MYIQDAIDACLQALRCPNNDQTPCQGFVRHLDGSLEQALVDLLVKDYADLSHDIQYVMTQAARRDPTLPIPTVDEAHLWVACNKDELVGLLIQAIQEQRAGW